MTLLRWILAPVVFIEAGFFVFGPHSGHDVGSTHMPQALRLLLGWGEILGAVLLLVPRTLVRGAWLLLAIFVAAILIHLCTECRMLVRWSFTAR